MTSFYKFVLADIVVFVLFIFFTFVTEWLFTLYAKPAYSDVESWHGCHVCVD